MTPLAVVGDVHGDLGALRVMLSRLKPLDRRVIFLGDYVNGGPESAAVLETLCDQGDEAASRWHFLAGNHDLALLDYVRDGDFAAFAALGGVSTLAAYLPAVHGDVHTALVRALPDRHRRFLEALAPCWESEEYLVAHTGFSPEDPGARSFEALCRKGDPRVFSTSGPRPLVVCGHYAQRGGRPFHSAHLICLDTGCGMHGGPLTAVLLPEREFISVRPSHRGCDCDGPEHL